MTKSTLSAWVASTKLRTHDFSWVPMSKDLKTDSAKKLADYCHSISPAWTSELDSAARIILFAVNEGLASKDGSRYIFSMIENLINQNKLCNSDLADIAVELLEDSYFQYNIGCGTFFSEKDCQVVQQFSDKWVQKKLAAA